MEFDIFTRLLETPHYLRIADLVDGRAYLIQARNASLGIWRQSTRSFTIRRSKWGDVYLDSEYHWDHDSHATAKPFVLLPDAVPDDGLLDFLGRLAEATSFDMRLEIMWQASLALADARHG